MFIEYEAVAIQRNIILLALIFQCNTYQGKTIVLKIWANDFNLINSCQCKIQYIIKVKKITIYFYLEGNYRFIELSQYAESYGVN